MGTPVPIVEPVLGDYTMVFSGVQDCDGGESTINGVRALIETVIGGLYTDTGTKDAGTFQYYLWIGGAVAIGNDAIGGLRHYHYLHAIAAVGIQKANDLAIGNCGGAGGFWNGHSGWASWRPGWHSAWDGSAF